MIRELEVPIAAGDISKLTVLACLRGNKIAAHASESLGVLCWLRRTIGVDGRAPHHVAAGVLQSFFFNLWKATIDQGICMRRTFE